MNEREFNEWAANGGLVQDEYTNLVDETGERVYATKTCKGCAATLRESDPDVCERCDLHSSDRPATVVGKLHAAMAAVNAKSIWLPNVKVTTAKANSANPNALYLKDAEGTYVGKITAGGEFKRAWEQNLSVEAKNELRAFVTNGAAYLAEVGKATNHCCFCGLELTDPESVQYGWGPICAKKHNLPHSNRHGF